MTKAAELTERVSQYLDTLKNATDQAKASELLTRYLSFGARFHNYSAFNQLLIQLQHPEASRVAGYNKWLELKRQVQKGSHGISILAPMVGKDKKNPDLKAIYGFRSVSVFDVSQTEGEPLPEAPEWKSLERQEELHARLIGFCQTRNISVAVKAMHGETQGWSAGGTIALRDTAGTKTLVHEIAHELLHQRANGGVRAAADVMEVQAESVAFVVCQHFALPSAGSANYLALWGANGDSIQASLQAIQKAATEIITAVEKTAEETPDEAAQE